MRSTHWKSGFVFGVVIIAVVFAYQNCGPAKLSGDSPSGDSSEASTVTTPLNDQTQNPAETPKYFHLRTRVNQSSVIDAENANIRTTIRLWEPLKGNPNQNIEITSAGEIKLNGKCLAPIEEVQGSAIFLQECTGIPNQVFTYSATTGIIQSTNGMCVDLTNNEVANGTGIVMWRCHGEANQQWDLVPAN